MHIQLDPVGGLAGDMFVAAMLDAFPPMEEVVQTAVRAAGLPERFRCEVRGHKDHALTGKQFLVLEATRSRATATPAHGPKPAPQGKQEDTALLEHARDHQHGHRPFAEIRAGLAGSSLKSGARHHAIAIFTLLAEAEAQVHGATTETVTFHELGEWDSIADIVAAAAIIHALDAATCPWVLCLSVRAS